jgi:acyl-CoA synthetase (AMP-forming)/AMP-acid ligase II
MGVSSRIVVFVAPEPPLTIPDVPLTPLLLERARIHRDRPAFIDGVTGRVLTHAAWARSVVGAAAALHARGLRKGDVAAVLSPNMPEYAVAFHAVSLAGGATTIVNPLGTPADLETQLLDANAKFLFTIPALMPKVEACRCPGLREVFLFGGAHGPASFDALCHAHDEAPTTAIDTANDLVALPYSSGTAGLPKGVMLTHRNLVANTLQAACALDVRPDDRLLALLPFFHIYGLGLINVVLHQGAAAVIPPPFELQSCLATIRTYGVTYAPLVPPIIVALAASHVDASTLPTLRIIVSGAASLPKSIGDAVASKLACSVIQGYGLTETSPLTHATRAGSNRTNVEGVGPPAPNTEARLVNVVTGMECEPHEQGEICVRGPQVMKGYLNRPEETAAAIDCDGWLHTGDLGYADQDSCFFIVDRLKEVIKYKGWQVAPAELEALLVGHHAVADAAVVGVPDAEVGERPKAFIVLKVPATADEILAYVEQRVAPHKRLHSVEFIERIPKSPSGKILRRLLVAERRAT